MGLFLQTAIIPDCEMWEIQEAVELSANLPAPVLLLYIYDGDFWGYCRGR